MGREKCIHGEPLAKWCLSNVLNYSLVVWYVLSVGLDYS